MAVVKKSKKKKIIIAVCIVLAVAGIAAGITAYAIDQSVPRVELYTIGKSDIYETVDATGTVSAGTVKSYKVDIVATVKEVFVQVGDEVKKGDRLATFDTSSYDEQIKNLQKSYEKAKDGYNDAVSSQKEAKANLSQLNGKISALQKEINALQKSVSTGSNKLQSSIADTYNKAIARITDIVNSLSDDTQTTNLILSVVMQTIAGQLDNGVTSPSAIANAVVDALNREIDNGNIKASTLRVSLEKALEQIRAAINSQQWGANAADSSLSQLQKDASKLAYDEIMMASYNAEKQIYSTLSSDTLLDTRKELVNTTKEALDALNESKQALAAGWTADFDGVITDCSIAPGQQTSLISSGITLQNLDKMTVTVSLGEYDIHKVEVGMPVKITTAYGNYTGSVISKAPIAGGGSDGSLLDSVGSMMGISGMSSLTQTGAGVDVKISVDNPDDNIIVGFDAGVEISVGEHLSVPTIPSESMIHDKTGTYVYLYNQDEKTVSKTKIETGAMSYTEYEIKSGLKEGDRIIYAPLTTYEEESFEVKVSN